MSDYDVVIKLDPGQPVAGAAKVTEAVAKVETQAKKTAGAMDGIAAGVKKISFQQAAGAVNQAFSLLDQQLKITDTGVGQVIGSAVKFGALGAQVGGPWGAAIGAIGGALVDLSTKFDGVIGDARRFIEAKEEMEAFTNAIAYGASEVHRLTMGFESLHKALDGISAARAIAITAPGLIAVDQANKDLATQKDLLDKLHGPRQQYYQAIDNINALYKSGKIDQVDFNRGLELINEQFGTGAAKVGEYVDKLADVKKQFLEILKAGTSSGPKFGSAGRTFDANQSFDLATSASADQMFEDLQKQRSEESPSNLETDVANAKAKEDHVKELAANTKKWNDELKAADKTLDMIGDQLKSAATTLGDALVDAANGANVSFTSVFKGIAVGIEKAIVQALILKALTGSADGSKGAAIGGGYSGLFGLLGFASGAVIAPTGSGTTDTQTMMFRKAPSETVRIHTPAQEAAFSQSGSGGGGSGPINVTLEDRRDPRALMRGSDFDRAVLDVQRRYPR